MKRADNLYPEIYDFENLHKAYLLARRNKRYRGSVLDFSQNLEENLIIIQNELIWHQYKTGSYHEFYVYEPKKRLIKSLAFKDRVVQHALNNIIEPIFDSTFIYDSYACRKGKGIHSGIDRLAGFIHQICLKHQNPYVLKGDVHKYFPSINHKILFRIISKKIKCPKTLKLINKIIQSDGEIGIPIGNLTSQLFANIYLNQLDHYIKENLGIKYYIRYMDDFVIIHQDKVFLNIVLDKIESYLNNNLDLKLNGKTSIFPLKSGIDFLGYRSWRNHRLLRKSNIIRIKRTFKYFREQYNLGNIDIEKINSTIQSWLGHAKHANTYNLRCSIFNNLKFEETI
jgi:retron-type reverse transcriptase